MQEPAIDRRSQVHRLEHAVAQLPQVDLQTEHVLIPGVMYARTITIPAGVVLVGAAHKTDHLCVMVGDIEVLTDEGPKRLAGQHVLKTMAGMKRAGYALAETRWTTICRTNAVTVEEAEAELVDEPERLQTRTLLAAGQRAVELEG